MSEQRRARGRSKTKDPNDVPETAAPPRARRATKDPNDYGSEAEASAPPNRYGSEGQPFGPTQATSSEQPRGPTQNTRSEQPFAPAQIRRSDQPFGPTQTKRSEPGRRQSSQDEVPLLTDDFLYRRYRSPRGKKGKDADLDTLSELSGSHHSEEEEGEGPSPGASLRESAMVRSKTFDFSGLMHRFSELPEPKFDSEDNAQEMTIEDVGSGEDAEGRTGSKHSQDLEVTALPGSMTAIGDQAPGEAKDAADEQQYGSGAPKKALKPALKSQQSTLSRKSHESLNSAYTWGSEDEEHLKRAPEDGIEDADLHGLVEINTMGKLCLCTFMYYWAMMSGGVLLAHAWRYMNRDTDALAYLAMEIAVKHAQVHLAEALEPAIASMRMLDLAFRRGAVTSRVDVVGIHRVLAPLFLLQPTLLEVEVVDPPELPPEDGRSSLLVSRALGERNLLELKTRWEDCLSTGCGSSTNSTDPPSAYGEGSWYNTGRKFAVPLHSTSAPWGTWLGPCVGNCQSASFSWVGRIAGGHGAASSPQHTLVGRATLDLQDFISATRRAASISSDGKGSPAVMLCTHSGRVMTGIDHEGVAAPLTMPKIWTMGEAWAKGADHSFVSAGAGQSKRIEGFTVTAWKLHNLIGPNEQATYASDWHLRLVLAMPDSVFEDSFLSPLYPATFIVSVVPMVAAALLVLHTLYRLCVKRYKKSKILAAATTLRNNIDSSESKKAVKDAMEAFEFEAALNRTAFQDSDKTPGQARRAQKESIVLGGLFGTPSRGSVSARPSKKNSRPASAGMALTKWMSRKQTVSPQASGKQLALQNDAHQSTTQQRSDPMGLALEDRK